MAIFTRNIKENNRFPEQDADTLVYRLLLNILKTVSVGGSSVETELLDTAVRSYYTSDNLATILSDNSVNPAKNLILYKLNDTLNFQSTYTDNTVPTWKVNYDLLFKISAKSQTTDFDKNKATKIIQLVEQYLTSNILSYSTNNYEYRTDINGKIYGTSIINNERVDNPLDNIFFQDLDNTGFIQTAITIKFNITQFTTT